MVNKILVAIDFSDCSINALEHALTIADRAKADIKMVWVNKPESAREIYEGSPEGVVDEATKRFDELKKKYRTALSGNKINFTIKEGKIFKEIVREAKNWGADLIIAGTHGSSGFEEFWAGSNANKIVSATDLPTITIRGGVDIDRVLKKIVLPIDSTVETRQKVPFTVELARLFNAEIYVLAVHTTTVTTVQHQVDQYAQQALHHIKDDNVKCRLVKLEADNIARSVMDYAVKVDANLIAIMTEQEKTPMNLLLGPFASQFVNHSPIPILSIHTSKAHIQLSR